MVLPHHVEQFGDARTVELVEDIVQQQYGLNLLALVGVVELCEAQRQGKRLLLALRAKAFHRLPVYQEQKVILVNAEVGKAAVKICCGGAL